LKALIILILLGACVCWGDDPVLLNSGTSAAGWSAPQPIAVATESGSIPMLKRTRGLGSPGLPVEYVYPPDGSCIIFREAAQSTNYCYFSIAGRLVCVTSVGTDLQFRTAVPLLAGESVESYADEWLASNLRGQLRTSGLENPLLSCRLLLIFGRQALVPHQFLVQNCFISSMLLTNNTVTLSLHTITDYDLRLTFSSDLQLLSAAQNGTPRPTLLDGQHSFDGGNKPWTQKQVVVESSDGPTNAWACDKAFDAPGYVMRSGIPAVGPMIPHAPSIRLLVMPSGDVWVGPSFCKLALVNGKIIGVTVFRQTGQLMAFVGPRVRIPMAEGVRISAIQALRSQVEAQVATGSFPPPDKTINVAGLFTDNAALQGQDTSIQALTLEGSTLVVDIAVSAVERSELLRVKLAPDLQVLSAERK
jgi:hypothetical protein